MLSLFATTMETYVLHALLSYAIASVTFHSWMSKTRFDICVITKKDPHPTLWCFVLKKWID
jgi:hypothetical protein